MKADCREVVICRRISFSSGHRYFNPAWSDEENRAVYGSCYSPHGHGHNYSLEVYLQGPIDGETGMVVNLKEVDRVLKEITEPLDHHFLNEDVPYFKETVPTTEQLAFYCYSRLKQRFSHLRCRLTRVRLRENEDLWVDYGEEI